MDEHIPDPLKNMYTLVLSHQQHYQAFLCGKKEEDSGCALTVMN